MNKNFDDFKSIITNKKIEEISNEITNKLLEIDDEFDELSFERSFNLSLTMRLLNEYHNWLNK